MLADHAEGDRRLARARPARNAGRGPARVAGASVVSPTGVGAPVRGTTIGEDAGVPIIAAASAPRAVGLAPGSQAVADGDPGAARLAAEVWTLLDRPGVVAHARVIGRRPGILEGVHPRAAGGEREIEHDE